MESEPYTKDRCVCAVGVFDGVHRGHRALLESLADDGTARDARPVAVTFDRDPDELFCPERVHKLLSNEERIAALRQLVPDVLALHFTTDLAEQSWQGFLRYLLTRLPGLEAIHVGENFHFGASAAGGIPELTLWGTEQDISVVAEPLYSEDGETVSASRIRALLAEGDVNRAARLLTRAFALTGRVVQGAGRGHGLGFATANVEVDGSFAEMGPYVYAAYALLDEKRYKAAASIGEPPTYSPESQAFDPFLLEAHLLDFDGDLYGRDLTLEFVHRLRPMQRFDSQEELIAAVRDNIAWVRENL
ncbi:MAG: riboflavin biosynthesis protein RibF [Coriobacteriales bacterium]|jgi:riboflavin kinase/FMN adenylyltransferase|nr:riboflavin biosynthesis protein RibF [Coriobacteriales bacterium]